MSYTAILIFSFIVGLCFIALIINHIRSKNINKTNPKNIVESMSEDITKENHDLTPIIEPTKLIIGDNNKPLIEITRFEPPQAAKYEDVILNESLKASFSSFMQQAPNMAMNAANMASSKYLVQFSAEVSQGLSNGSLGLMKSLEGGVKAVAVDGSGKIVELGKVNQVSGLNPATAGLAVWQVLAIITAQKYLSDINKKLANIESGIEYIMQHLKDDRLGKIYGNFNYLRQIANSIKNQTITEIDYNTFNNQIEHIERECSQIMEALELSLNNPLDNIKAQKFNGMGLEDNFNAAKKYISDFENNARPYLTAMYVRIVAARVKCALPVDRKIAELRVDELKQKVEKQKQHHDNFKNEVEKRIPSLRGFFSFDETDKEYQNKLRNKLNDSLAAVNKTISEMTELIASTKDIVKKQIEELQRPVQLEVTLKENGEIDTVKKITYEI